MKKFLLGFFVGVFLAILSIVVIGFTFVRIGQARPHVADNSILVLHLRGEIPEKPAVEMPIPFLPSTPAVTVRDTWSMLRHASSDSRVKAILLYPEDLEIGWGKLQEIRADLMEFKKTGKPVFAFLRTPGSREYYLASCADKIYMGPEDELNIKGLRAELMYFKNTLDKIGVKVEVMHIGKYKDAGDMFTQTTASPETQEVMNSMLDAIYGNMVNTFASARKKTPDEMKSIIDEGPFTAKQAKQYGLIDELRYEDQVYGELKGRLHDNNAEKLSFHTYSRALTGAAPSGAAKIAFLVGDGTITRGSDDSNMNEGFTSAAFIKQVRKVAEASDIKGVILRVDSPGGDAIASDEMLREIELLRAKKPLVISMSDTAASGGYYVSMTGDPIVAYPLTITGSIGIIYGKLDLRGLYDKLGVTKDILMRGKDADIDSDYHPLDERGKAKLQQTLQDFYSGFVSKAAASRHKSYDQLNDIAQGRVWMGSQAKDNGLVDDLGGIDKAIELIKKKANIPASQAVQLVSYPGKRSIFDELFKTGNDDSAIESKIRAYVGPALDYKLWMRGGVMRVMPYQISIK